MPSSCVDRLLEPLSSGSDPALELDQAASGPALGDVWCASITVTVFYVVDKLEMRPNGALVCAFTGVEVSPAPDQAGFGTW